MRTVKAAAVQLSPVLYSREGTVDKVVQKIHELGHEGVRFATFPETVVAVKKVDARGGVLVTERSKASPIRSSNRFDSASVVSWALRK